MWVILSASGVIYGDFEWFIVFVAVQALREGNEAATRAGGVKVWPYSFKENGLIKYFRLILYPCSDDCVP
jgi:hypothetical protein